MKVAREGIPFIVIAWVLTIGAYALGVTRHSIGWHIAAVPLLLIAMWVVYFFRDPERTGERGENLVVSPADGLVVLITDVQEPSFIAGPTTRISIFMNVFSVHVNPLRDGSNFGARVGALARCPVDAATNKPKLPEAGKHCDSVAGHTLIGGSTF